jgi:DNA-binding transcriptional ArsR family regulator
MAASKKELFTEEQQKFSEFFKALAHPARLAIIEYIASSDSCITGDISEFLPLSRTTVNQHLAELKAAGLIQGTISGTKRYYCINTLKIEEFNNNMNKLVNKLIKTNVCCNL